MCVRVQAHCNNLVLRFSGTTLPCPLVYAAYTQYFADHAAELHYYIQPRVVEEVPPSLTSGQYVAQLEEGEEGEEGEEEGDEGEEEGDEGDEGEDGEEEGKEGEEGEEGITRTLVDEAHAFLASDSNARLLLLLGEAGSGKSMFTWLTAQQRLAEFEAFEKGLGGQGGVDSLESQCPWIPVVIDLKRYRTSELMGLLPRFLKVPCA